jgi:acetylornithine deacetylase/succinyl-diaminopimelate desuccinylase-like protein
MVDQVLRAIDSSHDQSIAGLKDFLRIPSVSTKPEHKPDMERCAAWLVDQLRSAGLRADVAPTAGHPCVLAKNDHKPGRPTVLLYGHYDVQPPEPLNEWIAPPFEPGIRKTSAGTDAIYARGAVDDKGQVWCHVQAIKAWQQQNGSGGLPINLTFIIEGEEEIGSSHLDEFVHRHKAELKADIALVSDTDQFDRGVPAITYGLRGLLYMEVILTGPGHDLHSGMFGGAVPNAANALCELLSTLHDPATRRVNIPGFYDDVDELAPREREEFTRLPFNEQAFKDELKLSQLIGESGFTTLERRWARPTCDINGLTSGYQGPGAKTVIPARASAKISMRLVPHQDPAKIEAAFKRALTERCPEGCSIEFLSHGGSPALLVPFTGRPMQLAAAAIERGFNGKKPVFMREGGSIPILGLLKNELGLDTLLVGFGLPDDRVHSPNEKFDLDCLFAGTRTAACLYDELSRL